MIEYKYPEEQKYVEFFAKELNDDLALSILASDDALTKETATYLSMFFWRMVDCSIEFEKNKKLPWPEGSEFWCEKLINSIGGYIERSGFADEWDEVLDSL